MLNHVSSIARREMRLHAFPMNELERFGALLKRARDQRDMTIDTVGAHLGRPGTWYWRLETAQNKTYPEPETLSELNRVLGVPRRDMLLALGYLDPDERESGVVYVVREDDPRAALLALLDDATDSDVAAFTDLMIAMQRLYSRRRNGAVASDGNTPTNQSA
jgi:transcriptional regulator with XRE-family HTH domain